MGKELLRWVIGGLVGLGMAGSVSAATTTGGMEGYYAVGAGVGYSRMRGDYIASEQASAIQLGYDATTDHVFVLAQSGFLTNNDYGWWSLLAGGGLGWLKLGTGIMGEWGSTPTRAGVSLSPYSSISVVTDSTKRTQISNLAIPLYLRLTPWRDHDNLLNLDAWTSLKTSGSEKIPVEISGAIPAYYQSDWASQSRISGGALRYTRRISGHFGLNLDLLYMEGVNKRGSLPSYFGAPVAAPKVHWYTEALILSVQSVF